MNDDYVPLGRKNRRRGKRDITYFHHYRFDVFVEIIDLQLQELDNRFDEVSTELLLCMICLSPVDVFSSFDKSKLLRLAKLYPDEFSNVDLLCLEDELDNFVYDMRRDDRFQGLKDIGELSVKLVETKKHEIYRHVYSLIKMVLILPVATASAERAFLAMTYVKNKLRNSLGDEFLNDCLHLVIKVSRRAFFSVVAPYQSALCSSTITKHTFSTIPTLQRKFENTHRISCPSNYVKWGSPGFCRTLSFATGFTPLKAKPLEKIIDVQRAKNKSPEELADIWDDFHLGRGHIGLSMKAKLYHLLEQRAADCRYFVIPLWKGSGYTTMFVQVEMPHMLFTGLEDYKARGTQAAPYLTAKCYKEFADSKDLVLIRGDVVFASKLTDEEAKWLLETAQSFYLNDVRYKLVERFNKETREFEFTDVLKALEMPIL